LKHVANVYNIGIFYFWMDLKNYVFIFHFVGSINMSYGVYTSCVLTTDHWRTVNFIRLQRTLSLLKPSFTQAIPQPQAPIHHRSKISHGTFRSIPVFRTCTFRGITPSLLKSPIRKARERISVTSLSKYSFNIADARCNWQQKQTTPGNFCESYPRTSWLWHLVISRSAISFFVMLDENRPMLYERKKSQRWKLKTFFLFFFKDYFRNKRS